MDLGDLFDIGSVLRGTFGRKRGKCPRPFEDLVDKTGLRGKGVDEVIRFERLWAHFLDDLIPIVGPGAQAVVSGDWSKLTKADLTDMLGVWKVWSRYRQDLRTAAQQLNPLAKGGRGVDPCVSRAAQAQLRGFDAFQSAISVTEERERKGAFGRFKDWLTGKTTNLKQSIADFDLDEWAETGWGQAAAGLAGAGMVAAMSYTGDVQGYQAQRELPPRERFRKWQDVEARYPDASRLDNPASKSVTKLGYGTVVGHVPDGRVVLQTAVSLWVVDPSEL
jgi:hypothetical protein